MKEMDLGRRLTGFLCLFLCFFCLAASAAGVSKEMALDMQKDFERAQNLLNTGRETLALNSYLDFLRRYPQSLLAAEAQYAIGEIAHRQRNYTGALIELRKVSDLPDLREKKATAKASLLMGDCLLRLGHPREAKIEWDAVLRRFPKGPEAERAQIFLSGLDSETEK